MKANKSSCDFTIETAWEIQQSEGGYGKNKNKSSMLQLMEGTEFKVVNHHV